MIFEIKRSVNGNLSRVDKGDLTQTLLKGYYCGQRYGLKRVTACLTDVTTWHFMNCDCQPKDKGMISILGTDSVITADEYGDLIHKIASILLKGIDDAF